MSKRVRNLAIAGGIVLAVIAGAAAYKYYQESRKSGFEKAVDSSADAAKDAAKWTENAAEKTVKKTKQLFK